MSDRITNTELKEVHSYLEEIDNERFCTLIHKLLTTFNFLVINGREWKEKASKYTVLEVQLVERKQEINGLIRRLEKKQDRIDELEKELELEKENGERYFNAYKSCIDREERMKANIRRLKGAIYDRSDTKNEEK